MSNKIIPKHNDVAKVFYAEVQRIVDIELQVDAFKNNIKFIKDNMKETFSTDENEKVFASQLNRIINKGILKDKYEEELAQMEDGVEELQKFRENVTY